MAHNLCETYMSIDNVAAACIFMSGLCAGAGLMIFALFFRSPIAKRRKSE